MDGITGFGKDALEEYLGFETTPHVITHKPMGEPTGNSWESHLPPQASWNRIE